MIPLLLMAMLFGASLEYEKCQKKKIENEKKKSTIEPLLESEMWFSYASEFHNCKQGPYTSCKICSKKIPSVEIKGTLDFELKKFIDECFNSINQNGEDAKMTKI